MNGKHLSVNRVYRDTMRPASGEVGFQVVVEETDLFVIAAKDMHARVAEYVRTLRGELKNHILFHPEFLDSLEPLPVDESASPFIKDMVEAGQLCNVGPMAAVAGTIAQAVADRFSGESSDIIVENGGDVYMHSSRERIVALLADPESGAGLGLRILPEQCPLALCSSSGRIGHSLSLGSGDLVCVLSKKGSFADAAATALCNQLGTRDDLEGVIRQARALENSGLLGVFAQCDDQVAAWGELELVPLE